MSAASGRVTPLRRPPVRQSMATEVELTFAELGPFLTRVTVEHRGWERLTGEQLAKDCALPGGYLGGAYREGWARILACLAETSGGQP